MIQNDMEYTGNIAQSFEGLSLTRYQDEGGIWTIGRGHLWNSGESSSCTVVQADLWFGEDMAKCAHAVRDLVSVDVTQNQFNSLCDFVFNLGVGALASSTLLKCLNAGDYAGASGQFTAWDHVRIEGKLEVSAGLLRRRDAEMQLFLLDAGTQGPAPTPTVLAEIDKAVANESSD